FARAADELDSDREAAGGNGKGNGEAGKSCEIEPLRVAHGCAIPANSIGWGVTGPEAPIAFTVAKSGGGANRGEKYRDVFHYVEDAGAFEVARGGIGDEFVKGSWFFSMRRLQVIEENWAELRFFAGYLRFEKLGDYGSEKEPPEVQNAVEAVKF